MKFGRPRTRIRKQIIQNGLNVVDFVLDFGQNGAAGTFYWKLAAHHFDDAGDSRKGVPNFFHACILAQNPRPAHVRKNRGACQLGLWDWNDSAEFHFEF
jgi:hypothetical protein